MRHGRWGVVVLVVAVAVGCGSPPSPPAAEIEEEPAPPEVDRAAENERVILDFMAAWSRLDPDELTSYFTDDGIYDNVPTRAVQGQEAVLELITGITENWDETIWEVRTVLASDDVVIVERVDRTRAGDNSVDLPVVGVFEMEDGKIKEWRDYFDVATFRDAMQ